MSKDTEEEIKKLEARTEEIEKSHNILFKFKKKYPGIVMLITVISVFGTIFTTSNLFFGVQVRPAWHWEYLEVKESIARVEVRQLDLNRILITRDLARFESLRVGYLGRGEIVPDWLDEEIATIEAKIIRIGESIDANTKKMH